MEDLLKKILEKLILYKGYVYDLSFDKECEEILEKFAFLLKNEFIDQKILKEVIEDKLNNYLINLSLNKKFSETLKNAKKLFEISDINLDILVDVILKELNKLPYEYEIIFRLPNNTEKIFYRFEFVNNISLILPVTKEEFLKYYPEKKNLNGSKFSELIKKINSCVEEKVFKDGDSVLKINSMGYANNFGFYKFVNTKDPVYLFKVLISIYKIFGFLSVQNLNFETKSSSLPLSLRNLKKDYSFLVFDNNRKKTFRFELDTKDRDFIGNFVFNINDKENFNNFNIYLNMLFKLYNQRNKNNELFEKEIKKLMNAAFWFYEFSTSKMFYNSVIYLVSAFDSLIGIEIKDKLLKSELVSQSIFNNLIQIEHCKIALYGLYDLRNQIIHGNKEIEFNMDNYKIELEINFSNTFNKNLINIFEKNSLNDLLNYCSYFFIRFYKKKFFCFKKI